MDSTVSEVANEDQKTLNPVSETVSKATEDANKLVENIFKLINEIRGKIGSLPLTKNDDLMKTCRQSSEEESFSDANLTRSYCHGHGEIKFHGRLDTILVEFKKKVSESLKKYYNMRPKRLTEKTRLFSQTVWRASTTCGIGVAIKSSPANAELSPKVVIHIRFDPPLSNVATPADFTENILNIPIADLWVQQALSPRQRCFIL